MSLTENNLTFELKGHQSLYVGQLLLRADLIDQGQLDTIGGFSDRVPERLGQKLVLAGFITHGELHDVLHVQCLLREEAIDEFDALKILRLARKDGITAQEAISRLQLQIADSKPNSRFGDLLVEARILLQEQVDDALSRVASTGLPLGYILEISGLVSCEVLALLRDVQKAIRANVISRQRAVQAIAAAVAPASDEHSVDAQTQLPKAAPVSEAVSAPPMPPLPGWDQESAGEAALAIAPGYQLPPTAERTPPLKGEVGFGEFLVLCGLLQREEMERARKMCDGTAYGIETAVKKTHKGKQDWLELAGQCYKQMRLQRMTLDEAIYAFDFCKRAVAANQCTLAEATRSLASQRGTRLN